MSDAKKYPPGMYGSRYADQPDFVLANVKIDRNKAIEELMACDLPFYYIQVLRGNEPDKYGNLAYSVIDDYRMEKQRKDRQEGMAKAKAVVESKPKPAPEPIEEIPADDIPF